MTRFRGLVLLVISKHFIGDGGISLDIKSDFVHSEEGTRAKHKPALRQETKPHRNIAVWFWFWYDGWTRLLLLCRPKQIHQIQSHQRLWLILRRGSWAITSSHLFFKSCRNSHILREYMLFSNPSRCNLDEPQDRWVNL